MFTLHTSPNWSNASPDSAQATGHPCAGSLHHRPRHILLVGGGARIRARRACSACLMSKTFWFSLHTPVNPVARGAPKLLEGGQRKKKGFAHQTSGHKNPGGRARRLRTGRASRVMPGEPHHQEHNRTNPTSHHTNTTPPHTTPHNTTPRHAKWNGHLDPHHTHPLQPCPHPSPL